MADRTGIEWTDATWNPIVGCSVISPGCANCYAMRQAHRLLDKAGSHYEGTTHEANGQSVWTGKVALAPDRTITEPLRWKRPRKIFVNSMGDLFHKDVPVEWIDRVFAVMALAPQHTFQVLTKRAERMREYIEPAFGRIVDQMIELVDGGTPTIRETCAKHGLPWRQPRSADDWYPLRNVWLGVSVEDQRRAYERVPLLRDTPAARRFLSIEPLIGPIKVLDLTGIDWVIAGGESGHDARPMHPEWPRDIRDICQEANMPFFFKQWGEWRQLQESENRSGWMLLGYDGIVDIPDNRRPDDRLREVAIAKVGKKEAGRALDGREWNEFPRAGNV